MDGRGKIRFRSEEEMNDAGTASLKPMSLFESYKQKKKVEESIQNESKGAAAENKNACNSKTSHLEGKSYNNNKTTTPDKTRQLTAKASNNGCQQNENTTTTAASDAGTLPGNSGGTNVGGKAVSSNSIIVNYRQRGNPILKHIRNVTWEYGSIIPDYVLGKTNCALFLSLRYHQLNPTYIHNRLKELGKGYDLRVLLVQVDVKESHHLLKDLAKICILADCTLILAFSVEEAGRYLEAYKVYENKPPEALMGKTNSDFISKLTETLTAVKSVNKTDCMTLLSTFKTMKGIIGSTKEDLSLCPGFGPQKAQRLHDVFHEPFVKGRKRKADGSPTKTSTSKTSPSKTSPTKTSPSKTSPSKTSPTKTSPSKTRLSKKSR